MDLQEIIDNAGAARRMARAQTTNQLILIELISELKTVKDKEKILVFDDGKFIPDGIDSWRGVYAELAIGYAPKKEAKAKTVNEWIKILTGCIGKVFEGWKGGDFQMGKVTQIWVANPGESSGFKSDRENNKWFQGVVGVVEKTKVVSLISEAIDD